MAHPTYKDAGGLTRSRKGTGAVGNDGDPDIFIENIEEIAAGASPDIGATTDAAITSDTDGSMIGFLRGLVKWAFERMPASLGQKAMSASLAVVIANDQSAIPLAAGATSIGGVKLNGPQWARGARTIVDSADASASPADLSAAPASGEYVVIDSLFISVGAALTVTVKCETTGAVLYKLYMAANTSISVSELTGSKLATADKKIQIQTSGAGNIFAVAQYHSEA